MHKYVEFNKFVPQDVRDEVNKFFATHLFRVDPFNNKNPIHTIGKTLRSKGYGILFYETYIEIFPLFVFAEQELRANNNKDAILKSFRDHGFSDEFIRKHTPALFEP